MIAFYITEGSNFSYLTQEQKAVTYQLNVKPNKPFPLFSNNIEVILKDLELSDLWQIYKDVLSILSYGVIILYNELYTH